MDILDLTWERLGAVAKACRCRSCSGAGPRAPSWMAAPSTAWWGSARRRCPWPACSPPAASSRPTASPCASVKMLSAASTSATPASVARARCPSSPPQLLVSAAREGKEHRRMRRKDLGRRRMAGEGKMGLETRRMARRAHRIKDDETFSLSAGFTRFPRSWKRCTLVSWRWNDSPLSPPQIMQRFYFCWCVTVFNVHKISMKCPLRLA